MSPKQIRELTRLSELLVTVIALILRRRTRMFDFPARESLWDLSYRIRGTFKVRYAGRFDKIPTVYMEIVSNLPNADRGHEGWLNNLMEQLNRLADGESDPILIRQAYDGCSVLLRELSWACAAPIEEIVLPRDTDLVIHYEDMGEPLKK